MEFEQVGESTISVVYEVTATEPNTRLRVHQDDNEFDTIAGVAVSKARIYVDRRVDPSSLVSEAGSLAIGPNVAAYRGEYDGRQGVCDINKGSLTEVVVSRPVGLAA